MTARGLLPDVPFETSPSGYFRRSDDMLSQSVTLGFDLACVIGRMGSAMSLDEGGAVTKAVLPRLTGWSSAWCRALHVIVKQETANSLLVAAI